MRLTLLKNIEGGSGNVLRVIFWRKMTHYPTQKINTIKEQKSNTFKMYTYLHVLCPSLRVLGFGKTQRRQQGGGVGGFLLPIFYPPPQRERKRGKENKGRHTFLKKGTFQLNLWNKRPLFGEKVHFILKYISKYNKTYLHPWKTHFVFFFNSDYLWCNFI